MPAAFSIDQLKHMETWSFTQAAAVWGYSAQFFRDLHARGEITGYCVRPEGKYKCIRVSAASVRAYFERMKTKPTQVSAAPRPRSAAHRLQGPRVRALLERAAGVNPLSS